MISPDDKRILNETTIVLAIVAAILLFLRGCTCDGSILIGDTNGDTVYPIGIGWIKSPSTNVAGYIVYIGTSSRTYTLTYDVGNVTNANVLLDFSTEFYMTVTAYDQLAIQSDFSNEVKYGRWPNDRITINWPTNPPATLLLGASMAVPRSLWTIAVPAPNSGTFTALIGPSELLGCLNGSTNALTIKAYNPKNNP